jgi:predicted Zn-dependent protease with MMP-like domain
MPGSETGMDEKSFEYYIARALESIPREFAHHLDNVEIMWEDYPSRELLRQLGAGSLFGLYEGIPLTERTTSYSMVLPDRITLYRRPILSSAGSEKEIVEQIRRTVIHEIGHHFGLSEEEIREAMGD